MAVPAGPNAGPAGAGGCGPWAATAMLLKTTTVTTIALTNAKFCLMCAVSWRGQA